MSLNSRQQEILSILTPNKQLTRREILFQLEGSIPDRTLQRDSSALKEGGLISHRGQTQNLVWFLSQDEKKEEP
jgi:predicted HTH transcriptional regulator